MADRVHVGLLVRLEAKPGKEAEVASFLRGGLQRRLGEPQLGQHLGQEFAGMNGMHTLLAHQPYSSLRSPYLACFSPSWSAAGARRRQRRHDGKGISARGDSASNKSLSLGRAAPSNCRH